MLQRVKFIHSEIIIKLDQIASISVQKEFNAPSQNNQKIESVSRLLNKRSAIAGLRWGRGLYTAANITIFAVLSAASRALGEACGGLGT